MRIARRSRGEGPAGVFVVRSLRFAVAVPAVVSLLRPAAAVAQAVGTATIAGTVTDASGAVLPGVTVEAASPALIEGTRSVVANEAGRYSIVNLRPGTYTVTFGGAADRGDLGRTQQCDRTGPGSQSPASATATKPVALIEPGTQSCLCGTFDLRFSKLMRSARYRVQVNADLYNAFNSNAVSGINTSYGASWQYATQVQAPRQVQISTRFDF